MHATRKLTLALTTLLPLCITGTCLAQSFTEGSRRAPQRSAPAAGGPVRAPIINLEQQARLRRSGQVVRGDQVHVPTDFDDSVEPVEFAASPAGRAEPVAHAAPATPVPTRSAVEPLPVIRQGGDTQVVHDPLIRLHDGPLPTPPAVRDEPAHAQTATASGAALLPTQPAPGRPVMSEPAGSGAVRRDIELAQAPETKSLPPVAPIDSPRSSLPAAPTAPISPEPPAPAPMPAQAVRVEDVSDWSAEQRREALASVGPASAAPAASPALGSTRSTAPTRQPEAVVTQPSTPALTQGPAQVPQSVPAHEAVTAPTVAQRPAQATIATKPIEPVRTQPPAPSASPAPAAAVPPLVSALPAEPCDPTPFVDEPGTQSIVADDLPELAHDESVRPEPIAIQPARQPATRAPEALVSADESMPARAVAAPVVATLPAVEPKPVIEPKAVIEPKLALESKLTPTSVSAPVAASPAAPARTIALDKPIEPSRAIDATKPATAERPEAQAPIAHKPAPATAQPQPIAARPAGIKAPVVDPQSGTPAPVAAMDVDTDPLHARPVAASEAPVIPAAPVSPVAAAASARPPVVPLNPIASSETPGVRPARQPAQVSPEEPVLDPRELTWKQTPGRIRVVGVVGSANNAQWRMVHGAGDGAWLRLREGDELNGQVEVRTGVGASVVLDVDGRTQVEVDRLTRAQIARAVPSKGVSAAAVELERGRVVVREIQDPTVPATSSARRACLARVQTPDQLVDVRTQASIEYSAFTGTSQAAAE